MRASEPLIYKAEQFAPSVEAFFTDLGQFLLPPPAWRNHMINFEFSQHGIPADSPFVAFAGEYREKGREPPFRCRSSESFPGRVFRSDPSYERQRRHQKVLVQSPAYRTAPCSAWHRCVGRGDDKTDGSWLENRPSTGSTSNDLRESIKCHRFIFLMIVEGSLNGAACRGQSVPGSAVRRRDANPPAATLLTGQAAREWALDSNCVQSLMRSFS